MDGWIEAVNSSGRPELILSARQWRVFEELINKLEHRAELDDEQE